MGLKEDLEAKVKAETNAPKQAEKLIKLVEDKDLDDIIDEAIKEVQEPKKEEYKLTKEDIHEIKNYLVHLKDLNIESKNNSYKNMIEILKETHYIKKSQSSNNKTTYALMFAAGVAFGMADAKWMPFAKIIYDFFSTIIGKG